MAKTKYDENTFPLLAEGYARDGLTDEQIAAKLGISPAVYYRYQNKYREFRESIKRGKAPVDRMVENALFKKAVGYSYEEVHTYSRVKDDDSKERYVKTIKKEVQGDTTAQIFWLKNRCSDRWRDKQEIEQTVTDVTDISKAKAMFETMSPEERQKWLDSQKNN